MDKHALREKEVTAGVAPFRQRGLEEAAERAHTKRDVPIGVYTLCAVTTCGMAHVPQYLILAKLECYEILPREAFVVYCQFNLTYFVCITSNQRLAKT